VGGYKTAPLQSKTPRNPKDPDFIAKLRNQPNQPNQQLVSGHQRSSCILDNTLTCSSAR
jgi:hypothetical protein